MGGLLELGVGCGLTSFTQAFTIASQVGADTKIQLDTNDNVTLPGVNVDDLISGDVVFG